MRAISLTSGQGSVDIAILIPKDTYMEKRDLLGWRRESGQAEEEEKEEALLAAEGSNPGTPWRD